MYTEIFLRPLKYADTKLYGHEMRREISRLLKKHNQDVNPLLFAHGADGKSINPEWQDGNIPAMPVVFDAGKGYVRIYGVGKEGKSVVINEMAKIMNVLAIDTGSPVGIGINEGNITWQGGMQT